MRPLLLNDVIAAVRVLLAQPLAERTSVMHTLLEQAHAADVYRQRHGVPHPDWGTGTLAAVASGHRQLSPTSFDDTDYCLCWQIAVSAVVAWHQRAHRYANVEV